MKSIIIVSIKAFLGIILILGCGEKKNEINSEEVIPVKVAKITETQISMPVHSSGKLTAEKEAVLSFKTGGIVSKIFVMEGDAIKSGQILAKLKLDEIEALYNQAKVNYEKNLRDYNRIENLYKDSVVTLEQYQNVKSGLEAASSNLNIAKFNLNYSTITSPFEGKIYKKIVDENEIIAPGNPVFIVGSNTSSWKIVCGITDNDLYKINIGDSASVKFDNFNQAFSAVVSQKAGTSNPMNGIFEIELSLRNPDKNFISGMIASVDIFPSEKVKAKLIPVQALTDAEGSKGYVFYINNNIAVKQEVEIMEIMADNVFIKLANEKIGEVITEGAEYLNDGIKVNAVN